MKLLKTPEGHTIEIDPEELITADAFVFVTENGETKNVRHGTLGALIAQSVWSRLWMRVPEVRGQVRVEALEVNWDGEKFVVKLFEEVEKVLERG